MNDIPNTIHLKDYKLSIVVQDLYTQTIQQTGQFGKAMFLNLFKKDVQYLFAAAIHEYYKSDFKNMKVDLDQNTINLWAQIASKDGYE